VQTVGQSGDVPRAIAGYREYAAAYPDDPRAPVALARAVVLLEGQGDAEGAAQQRLELGRRYPAAEGADRALFLAGMHFLAGDRREEALGAWRAQLEAWRDDPGRLYLLARLAHERGVHYVALVAAERVAALGPGGEPAALRRLIYPAPYRAIVVREARERGLDPLALYALLRQESHFNPAATSWVGARGLAQVMPETAQGIAQALGVEGFDPDDLYRPEVSVRFGAFYLRRQLDNTGDSLPGALAAYNGGLSNAWRWAGGETVADQDMFVEQIDFAETRNYVKLVYGYYGAYRAIYRDEG
jgi:soluble lytic murein transglycosylase